MKVRPIRGGWIALVAVTVLTLAAGCSEEPEPPPTTISIDAMDVEDILAAVGETVAAISSAKFSLVDETESGAPFFGTTFQRMEAEVETPNDFRMLVDVVAPAFGFVQVEIVKVGDDALMKLFEGAPWSAMPPEEVPFDFEGLTVVFADLPTTLGNGAVGGRETVQGVSAVRVEGVVQSEALAPLIITADPGHAVDLILWVDDAFGLRQIRIAGQIYDDDAPETTRLLTIEEVNVPVDIELPETTSGS